MPSPSLDTFSLLEIHLAFFKVAVPNGQIMLQLPSPSTEGDYNYLGKDIFRSGFWSFFLPHM